ncbi:DUF1659 domain-containing protein [Shouchella shacheensis]|uniref:DUF1659 domain-containing protein n=1 Tax=Shouchella shacheensis TaxID=1649580 RepID=UPI000740056B|nr:DUF1659 domain-containing protein [Shouchella shacheensis]
MTSKLPISTRLGLVMQAGFDEQDNPIVRRSSYAVQSDADLEQLLAVADVFRSLCSLPVTDVTLSENSYLMA